MTRTQECRDQLVWIETNCPMDRTSVIPIRKANEFVANHVEISTLSTDAIQPLVKVKDTRVQEAAVATLKTMIDSGKKPTRKEVERVINVTTTAPHREDLIKKGKESAADPDGIKLYCGDFLTDFIKIPAGSIDCIITDPPYVKEWLHNYEAFAKAAVHVLKPGGFLIAYIGHIHMDKILAQMTPHIDYFWTSCSKNPRQPHRNGTLMISSRGLEKKRMLTNGNRELRSSGRYLSHSPIRAMWFSILSAVLGRSSSWLGK